MRELDSLRRSVASAGRVVVAFSGGVDSGLLAWVAQDVLGDAALAATAVSPSLAEDEREECRRLASAWALHWVEVGTDEMARAAYTANGPDRCYHCKSALMDRLVPLAEKRGAVVALGVNLDDLADHRPGQAAAREAGAVFPLVEAGMGKAAVRQAARCLGLEVWDKPSAACLASRIPYGTPVSLTALEQVSRAESVLRRMGFREIRVRHYGNLARIEMGPADIAGAFERRAEVVGAVKAAGYLYVTLDLEGLRSGSLNLSLGDRGV